MLRVLNAVVYAVFAAFGAAMLAPPLLASMRALVREWSYEPDLRWPWMWLGLGLLLFVVLADTARRIVARRRVGLLRYVLLLVVVALCGAARRLAPPPSRPPVNDALAHLVARVEAAADQAWADERRYPLDAAVLSRDIPPVLRDLGFRRRGARALLSRVTVVPQATGPVYVPPEELRPGDVVFAVDGGRAAYWITGFRLERGRLRPFTTDGRVVVAAGRQGRPASRLDPLFPEYPRKSAPRAPTSPDHH